MDVIPCNQSDHLSTKTELWHLTLPFLRAADPQSGQRIVVETVFVD